MKLDGPAYNLLGVLKFFAWNMKRVSHYNRLLQSMMPATEKKWTFRSVAVSGHTLTIFSTSEHFSRTSGNGHRFESLKIHGRDSSSRFWTPLPWFWLVQSLTIWITESRYCNLLLESRVLRLQKSRSASTSPGTSSSSLILPWSIQ